MSDFKAGIIVLVAYSSIAAMFYIGYTAISGLINFPY
jgi:hypothetical protein